MAQAVSDKLRWLKLTRVYLIRQLAMVVPNVRSLVVVDRNHHNDGSESATALQSLASLEQLQSLFVAHLRPSLLPSLIGCLPPTLTALTLVWVHSTL